MLIFKTVEEKAEEWGVSQRHIQYLCREGRIESAVKRAGAWFIPDSAQYPEKKVHSISTPYVFTGTKKKIFENAICLFRQRGYDNVSINDIAELTGIRQSAVYNHFKSKQEILDTIYGFYHHYGVFANHGPEDADTILQTSDPMEIITNGFVNVYEDNIPELMASIVKIVSQRVTIDEKAAGLFKKLILEEKVNLTEAVLNKAVNLGLYNAFDTRAVSMLINSVRLHTLLWWLTDPPAEDCARLEQEERSMYALIISLLPDVKRVNIREQ